MKFKKIVKYILNILDLKKLKRNKVLYDKDVFILGSAPNPDFSLYTKDKLLITCNASAASAKKNGLAMPSLTIVDNELIDQEIALSKPSRKVIIENKILEELPLGDLIAVQSNFSEGGYPNILGAKYNNFLKININLRRMILQNVLKVGWIEEDDLSLASTGGFAIALCAFLNARSITFEGFNLFQNEGNDLKHFVVSFVLG